jgi:ribonuclease-3 family protein
MIQHNGLTLAYIGDAYYELKIREYLLKQKYSKVNDLHNNAIKFTSAVNQAIAAKVLVKEYFNEDEISIFKRGRNQTSTHKPKNADVQTYNFATGFESVIGFLYLNNDFDRLIDIINKTIQILEEFQ